MTEYSPEFGPPTPPVIPEGVLGELRVDGMGKFFVRHELNSRWVCYRFFDEDGDLRQRGVSIPRFQIISDEIIREGDAEDAALEDAATR